MKGLNNHGVRRLLVAGVIFLFASCIKDDLDPIQSGAKDANIEFTLKLPSGNSTDTRSLTLSDEDSIEDLRLFIFHPTTGIYEYSVVPTPVIGQQNRYTANISAGNWDIVMLANSADHIRTCFGNSITAGTTLDEFTEKLQVTLTGSGAWNSTPRSNGYMSIPMWAYKKNTNIQDNTSFIGTNSFRLLRMLARVNVEVATGVQGIFKLTSVSLYNRQNKGQIVPLLENLNSELTASEKPSLVSGNNQVKGPVTYSGMAITDQKACTNEIYVFEMPEGLPGNFPDYPCLVIRGTYDGVDGYYRLDFARGNGTQATHMALTRNRTYNLLINSVSAPGYNSEENAYSALPVNIEADIIEWDDGGQNGWTDGQYLLQVDPGEFQFTKEARQTEAIGNKIFIKTDYPSGWQFDGVEYEGTQGQQWISFMGNTTGSSDVKDQRWLQILENTTGQSRSAHVRIKAGRIVAKIPVTQSDQAEPLTFTLYDEDMKVVDPGEVVNRDIFPWSEGDKLTYFLEWSPADADVEVTLTNPAGGLQVTPFSNSVLQSGTISDPEGRKMLVLEIPAYPKSREIFSDEDFDFPQRGFSYSFAVKYNSETSPTQTYTWKDELRTVQVVASHNKSYQGTYSGIRFRYNTPYQLLVSDPEQALDADSRSRLPRTQNQVSGTVREANVLYRVTTGTSTTDAGLATSRSYDGRKATVKFVDPTDHDKVFHEMEIENFYNYPNCYMLTGTDTSIEFPIRKAYQIWQTELSDEEMPSGNVYMTVIWQEVANLVSSATVSSHDDMMKATARVSFNGTTVGNAVVGLVIDDQIVYSWHLWRVNHDPSSAYTYHNIGTRFVYMNRNLGALSITTGTVTNIADRIGLYYQWGRKDPFPGPNALTLTTKTYAELARQVNSPSGRTPRIGAIPASGQVSNLKNSLHNPHIIYSNPNDPYDWYTNTPGVHRDDFWDPEFSGSKGIFDPCPQGWRVPHIKYTASGQTYHPLPTPLIAKYNISGGYWDMSVEPNPSTLSNLGFYFRNLFLQDNGTFLAEGITQWDIHYQWFGIAAEQQWGFYPGTYYYAFRNTQDGTTGDNNAITGRSAGMPVRCIVDDPAYWTHWNLVSGKEYDREVQ